MFLFVVYFVKASSTSKTILFLNNISKHFRQDDNLLKKKTKLDSVPLRRSSEQPSSIFDRDFQLQETEFKFVKAITHNQ